MDSTETQVRSKISVRLAVAVGTFAGLAVLLTLADPGITVDEPLDVRPGRTYLATLRARGTHFFDPAVVDAVFRDNAEHPPLGRWLLGIASTIGEPLEILLMGGADPVGLYVIAGRIAPAVAFAILVGLVTRAGATRYGTVAGAAAGFALLAMPRAFAHAHLGALDTFVSLFWTFALLRLDAALVSRRPGLAIVGAGVAWGLALLTKIHGWFLAPIAVAWACVRVGPKRAFAVMLAWMGSGLVTFFVGWPWLWYQTKERLLHYFGTGVDRTALHVQYFGHVYADKEVPWHYPWFYFAVTVPVGIQLLGLVGAWRGVRDRGRDPFPVLLLGSLLLFLVIFSTRVPIYDGERLFLLVFPAWAILVGRGFGELWERWKRRGVRAPLLFLLVAQAYGVVAFHPFQLSYYNALVGGLKGAEKLSLELTYWNDAVDPVLLRELLGRAQAGETAALAPTLYPGQGIVSTTRAMARRPLVLGDEDAAASADWVVVSRRSAYWKKELREIVETRDAAFLRTRQGVWLSGIWRRSAPNAGPANPRVNAPAGKR